jgi:hypothetical protein
MYGHMISQVTQILMHVKGGAGFGGRDSDDSDD